MTATPQATTYPSANPTHRRADIVVAAVGRAEMVKGDWLKDGAVVIDVGINRIDAPEKGEGKTRLVGDAHFESCAAVAGAITPVPGGFGPRTSACLLATTGSATAPATIQGARRPNRVWVLSLR